MMQGTTGNISIAGMLRLLCNYGRTGILKVEGSGRIGEFHLNKGDIVNVLMNGEEQQDKQSSAVQLLLVLEEGAFYFEESDVNGDSLNLCVEDLILESARRIYEGKAGNVKIDEYTMPENEVLKIAPFHKGQRVRLSINSEEWNLMLAFKNDSSIYGVLEESSLGKAKAETIIYGLVSAGLLRRTRFKIPEVSKIARREMGNIGAAIIDSAFFKLKIDRARIGMKEFLSLLNELELSFAEITGKTKAKALIEKIWQATK